MKTKNKNKQGDAIPIKQFHYFENHGDEEGRNSYSICYGDPDEIDHTIVGAEDTLRDAKEAVKRLNKIISERDIKTVASAIDYIEKQSKWISVADDMPNDGVKVLCYSTKYNDSFTAICHNKDNDGRFEFSDKCFYWAGTEVSHWMPLPAPPTTKGAQG